MKAKFPFYNSMNDWTSNLVAFTRDFIEVTLQKNLRLYAGTMEDFESMSLTLMPPKRSMSYPVLLGSM